MKFAWTNSGTVYHISNCKDGVQKQHKSRYYNRDVKRTYTCGTEVYSDVTKGFDPPKNKILCKKCKKYLPSGFNYSNTEYDITKRKLQDIRNDIKTISEKIITINSNKDKAVHKLKNYRLMECTLAGQLSQYKRDAIMVKVNDTIVIDNTMYIVWDLGCDVMCLVNKNTLEQYKKHKFTTTPFNAVFFFTADELKDINNISILK